MSDGKAVAEQAGSVVQTDVPLIELSNIRKTYGGKEGAPAVEVLHGLDLSISAGSFVALIGASGSGKSTLMHILGCLDKPTSGSYRFAGKDIASLSADELAWLRREAFGFVFQGYHLIPTLDALHNVQVPAGYAGMPTEQRQARAQMLLEKLGLGARGAHRPLQLSGGEQQRVSIARALMNGGHVILADEPTGALDSKSGAEVMALLRELAEAGHTVILITHDAKVAAQAQRVVRIRDGYIVEDTGEDDAKQTGQAADKAVRDEAGATFSTAVFMRSMATGVSTAAPVFASIREALIGAWRSLWVSRVRTFLTLLSFIIGVTSVIVLVAVGQGSGDKLMRQIALYGTHRMHVRPDVEKGTGMLGRLTEADVAVVGGATNVAAAMPFLAEDVMLRADGEEFSTEVWSVTPAAPMIFNWKIAHGVFFNYEDERKLAPVIVLGKEVRQRLFPDTTPSSVIGRYVLVNNVPFRVIGEMESKGNISGRKDDDDLALIPYATGSQRLFGDRYLNMVSVLLKDLTHLDQTVEDIRKRLRQTRRADDFRVSNRAAFVQAQRETHRQQTLLLGLIAGISLLVGGLGVMNIMLMSVKERTREIGIRMATGARQRDIQRQFLCEALVLSVVGGAAGWVMGIVIGASLIFWDVAVIFSVRSMLAAFGCAVITGLVFGFLPAKQASKLNPVEALAGE